VVNTKYGHTAAESVIYNSDESAIEMGSNSLVIEEPRIAAASTKTVDRCALSIVIGERCKMSSLGDTRNPRLAGREGTVVGISRLNSSIRVLFDGRKTPMSLHKNYIEPIPFKTE
jgi:hypothetical protein